MSAFNVIKAILLIYIKTLLRKLYPRGLVASTSKM